jgi:hypothetical protein
VQNLSYKLVALLIGAVIFVILTALAYNKSAKLFLKQDL